MIIPDVDEESEDVEVLTSGKKKSLVHSESISLLFYSKKNYST